MERLYPSGLAVCAVKGTNGDSLLYPGKLRPVSERNMTISGWKTYLDLHQNIFEQEVSLWSQILI